MGKSNDDGWKDLNKGPRKQDPYVNPVGNGSGNDNSGCSDKAAAMVIATAALGLTIRALVKGRS